MPLLRPLQPPPPRSKDTIKEAEDLPWDSGTFLLERARLSKWAEDGTSRVKPRKVNIRILINRI